MPLFYIPAQIRHTVSTVEALQQIDEYITEERLQPVEEQIADRLAKFKTLKEKRHQLLTSAASVSSSNGPAPSAVGLACLNRCLPQDRFIVCEAISK